MNLFQLDKKFRAFTLIELTISLIIGGIVISFSILLLEMINVQSKSVISGSNELKQIYLLDRLLYGDFEGSQKIVENEKNRLEFIFSDGKKVKYHFSPPDLIMREECSSTDTFQLKSFQLTLNYLQVNHSNIIYVRSIAVISASTKLPLTYYKAFSSSEYFFNVSGN